MIEFILFPQPEEVTKHLYRVTKPVWKCYITSLRSVGHKDLAIQAIKCLRRENGIYYIPFYLLEKEMEDPEHLALEVGHQDLSGRNTIEIYELSRKERIMFDSANLAKLYQKVINLKDNERRH